MQSLCGADSNNCGYGKGQGCSGCEKSNGCPFGKKCFIANCIKAGGRESFENFKKQLMQEFNELNIPGMPEIAELYPLVGEYVNLAYPMPNGKEMTFLNDSEIYLATQVHCDFNDELCRCYGLVAGMDFILVAEYGENGSNPELIVYKKR